MCNGAHLPEQGRALSVIPLGDQRLVNVNGWLREYMAHDCAAKTYVCVLYCSPCAPLMAPWLGELEGTSLAIA